MARDLDTASPAVETPPKLETMTATNNRRPNSNPIKRLKRWVKSLLFTGCEQLNTTSSWIQDRILHTTLEQKRAADNSAIPVGEMDRDLLAMHIRWAGHNIEKRVRTRGNPDRGGNRAGELKAAVAEWHRRGYPHRNFVAWAEENLRDYEKWLECGEPQFHPEHDLPLFGPDSPVIEVLKNRVSTRFWKPVPVEEEKIRQIIGLATHAPTACNRQAWKLYVCRNPDLSRAANAPGVLNPTLRAVAPVTIYIAIDTRLYPEVWAPAQDAGIIGLQLSLATTAVGLTGCLMYGAEMFPQEAWRRHYGIPDYQIMELMFLFGYPAERTLTNKRADAEDVAVFLDSAFEASG
ncbi:MAG TPA: nitroreductase family protein [Candidatus Limnocylindrales bacterium]|nr:nitroreductase family protein [Candidatus Limnocylindrales bacterium]